ncbi:MAG: RHS repeat domain-containing protein, partial [Bacteroidia bacterium]
MYSTNKYKYTWYVGPYIYQYDETETTPAFKINEVKTPVGVLRANASNLTSAYNVYQVTDHLGNVRATFKGTGTNSGIDVLSTTDYYAFGGELPGRKWVNEEFRFGYQGQEKNSESNPWYQFELRMYNQDIGRWFAPDPYGQFASPYIAMANNPVSGIDPDGGWVALEEKGGKKFKHKAMMERQKATNTGAYSYEATQARYMDEYNNLTKMFLSSDYGNRNDIEGY